MNARRAAPVLLLVAGPLWAAGCQAIPQEPEGSPPNPALRSIRVPPSASPADADRAALARFVGAWDFEGWSGHEGRRTQGAGRAAAVIEDEHFVLLDLEATTGQLGGRTGRKSGSMILASEPGIGVTLTAWGDAAPSISRLAGRAHGNGAVFTLDEARTPAGRPRLSMTITFETDDRWVAEIRERGRTSPPLARYTFTRAAGTR